LFHLFAVHFDGQRRGFFEQKPDVVAGQFRAEEGGDFFQRLIGRHGRQGRFGRAGELQELRDDALQAQDFPLHQLEMAPASTWLRDS